MDYRLFQPTYTDRRTGNPRRSDTHNIAFRDHLNRRQTLAASVRARDAHNIAAKVLELVKYRRSGEPIGSKLQKWIDSQSERLAKRLVEMDIIDPMATSAEKTLGDYLEGRKVEGKPVEGGYLQDLAAGDTDQHATQQANRIKRALKACNLIYFRDLLRPGITSNLKVWLSGLRESGEINGTTYNAYVTAIRGFTRWLKSEGFVKVEALAGLEKVDDVETDKDRRRELSIDEMLLLANSTANGPIAKGKPAGSPIRFGLTGHERALLYRFCFLTGMRPGQARALKVSDFDLSGNPPMVTSPAVSNKRRVTHPQPLHSSLVAELAELFKAKTPATSAIAMPSKYNLARMLREDLAAAREQWIQAAGGDKEREGRHRSDFLAGVNHQGERAVFYSTRHGFGTALADAGVPEKDIAAAMHHTSRVTTARYMHANRGTIARAVEALPPIAYSLAATGTEGITDPCLRNACATATTCVESGGQITGPVNVTEVPDTSVDMRNSAEIADIEHVAQLVEQRTFNPLPSPAQTPEKQGYLESDASRLRNACVDPTSAPGRYFTFRGLVRTRRPRLSRYRGLEEARQLKAQCPAFAPGRTIGA